MSKRVLLLLAAISMLAAACIKVNIDIEVRDDGSAEISGIVAMDAEALGDLVSEFGTREELCTGFLDGTNLGTDQATPDLDTKAYEEDGFCGIEFSGQVSAEQLANQIGDLGGGQDMTVRRDGDGWFFELPLGAEALGTEGFDDLGGLFDTEELLKDAEYRIRVKLPGRQIEHNADFIESDGTMVWDIDLLNPPERIFLRTEPGDTITGSGEAGSSSTGLILLIVALALAALGVASYFLMRNRKDGATTAPPTSPVADAASGPAASPPGQEPTQPPRATSPPQDRGTAQADPDPAPAPEPSPSEEPASSADPQVIASPTAEQATGSPVWDPVRRKYVQWDPDGDRWLVYDDEAKAWLPE